MALLNAAAKFERFVFNIARLLLARLERLNFLMILKAVSFYLHRVKRLSFQAVQA